MRADVKLGLAASVLVVLLAGWFFFDQDAPQSTIPILDGDSSIALFQGEPREDDIALPVEESSPDTLVAIPEQDTLKPQPQPVFDNEENPSGLADVFRPGDDIDAPVEERPVEPPVDESIGVATFSPPAPIPVPAVPRMETHTVKAGDTMVELARRYYGGARYLKALIEANTHLADVTALAVGDVVNLPDIDPIPLPPAETKPEADTANTHTVAVGDTLYRIALDRLGDASRWEEIYELNKDAMGEDAGALEIGQVLKLPVR